MDDDITYVDLRESYDKETLTNFYDHFLKPNFGLIEDELDSFEFWEECLTSPTYCGHIVLAMHNSEIIGGNAFEYFIDSNCAIQSYFVVLDKFRRRGIVKKLIDSAVEIADKDARKYGSKSCHASFIEVNKADPTLLAAGLDVMDPLLRHSVLAKIGFRAIDVTYIQPPVTPQHNYIDNLHLVVYATPELLQKGFIDGKIVQEFLASWFRKFECEPERDPYFHKIKEEIQVKGNKLRLLDLPWDTQSKL